MDFSMTRQEQEFIDRLRRSLTLDVRDEFREPERMILVMAMRRVGMNRYPAVSGNPSGEIEETGCLCSVCQNPNIEHPMDWRIIGYGNVPFLNVLCDGRRVKL